jgi:hypothetical protein
MPNADRLEDYARTHVLRADWAVAPDDEGYCARVRLFREDRPMRPWQALGSSPQLALDGAIDNAIAHWDALPGALPVAR